MAVVVTEFDFVAHKQSLMEQTFKGVHEALKGLLRLLHDAGLVVGNKYKSLMGMVRYNAENAYYAVIKFIRKYFTEVWISAIGGKFTVKAL